MGDYWQLTVDILQNDSAPIVDKPKLQEKYLTKPPFRYLHDIITAVQTNTGFAPGLYSGDELDAKAIQDKDAKVTYLNKIINVVGLVLNEHVPAKALKIVAGLEPENTNVFLQMLGSACRVGDGSDAVQKVLGGQDQPAPVGGRTSVPDRPSSRPSSQQRDQEDAAPEPPSRPSPSRTKRASDSKGAAEADPKAETKSKSKSSSKAAPPPAEPPPAAPKEEKKEKEKDKEKTKSRSKQASDDGPPPLAPADAAAPRTIDGPALDDPMRKSLMRPQSARKAPPKAGAAPPATPPAAAPPPAGGAQSRRADGARPPAAPAGPTGGNRPVSVMEEGKDGDSDNDVEVVHEAVPVAIGASRDVGGERGVLVKNIMEAEQNLKKAGEDAAGGPDEPAGTGIVLNRRKAGASAATGGAGAPVVRTTDTNAIKEMVQKLCQSSHPLAKSMDYLQEDLENMGKEYRFWQVEKRMFADKLAGEQRLLGDSMASETQLADLDGQIKQVRDRILGIKAQLLRNDETINKLLSMAVGR